MSDKGKHFAIAGGFAAACILCLVLIYKSLDTAFPGNQSLFQAVCGLVTPALLALGALVLRPMWTAVEDLPFLGGGGRTVRILLFGLPGAGKTTFIKKHTSLEPLGVQPRTEAYNVQRANFRLGEGDDLEGFRIHPDDDSVADVEVLFADYCGQTPDEVTVEPPREFFGPRHRRRINALFFIVDLAPVLYREKEESYSDEELLAWLERDCVKKIQARINENKEYLTKYSIRGAMAVCYSGQRPFTVKLLINKLDILSACLEKGYISGYNAADAEFLAQGLYGKTLKTIGKFCRSNRIEGFSVHLVSLMKEDGARSMLKDVLLLHSAGVAH